MDIGLFKSAFGFVEAEVFAKAVAKVEVNRVELRCGVVGKGNLVGNIVGEVSFLLPIPFSLQPSLCRRRCYRSRGDEVSTSSGYGLRMSVISVKAGAAGAVRSHHLRMNQ